MIKISKKDKNNKNEIEICRVDQLPEDKEELQKEVMKLRNEKEKSKFSSKDIKDIFWYVIIGLTIILLIFFMKTNPFNVDEELYVSNEDGYFVENIKPASEKYGENPIKIKESQLVNNLDITVEQITFKPTKTILVISAENNSNENINLMVSQKSTLIDDQGRNYKIDLFESDNKLNGTVLPPNSKGYTNLILEPVNKNAKELTYSLSVNGTATHNPWQHMIKFKL
ncbi:MAG: hypothetical protein ACOCP8_04235 [archaeon]